MSTFKSKAPQNFRTECNIGFFAQRKDVCVGVSLYLCRVVYMYYSTTCACGNKWLSCQPPQRHNTSILAQEECVDPKRKLNGWTAPQTWIPLTNKPKQDGELVVPVVAPAPLFRVKLGSGLRTHENCNMQTLGGRKKHFQIWNIWKTAAARHPNMYGLAK